MGEVKDMPITLAGHYVLYTCIETSQQSTSMYSYYSSIEMEGKLSQVANAHNSHSQGCMQEDQESKASLGCIARCCLRRERKVSSSHISSQNTGTKRPCQWESPQSSVRLMANTPKEAWSGWPQEAPPPPPPGSVAVIPCPVV